ncbi:hypothetical protein SUGI_0599840 [Cryptomeria japonica]|nr:hypothetical protein SUGI_0599840 [Cryptomeria japonica]
MDAPNLSQNSCWNSFLIHAFAISSCGDHPASTPFLPAYPLSKSSFTIILRGRGEYIPIILCFPHIRNPYWVRYLSYGDAGEAIPILLLPPTYPQALYTLHFNLRGGAGESSTHSYEISHACNTFELTRNIMQGREENTFHSPQCSCKS